MDNIVFFSTFSTRTVVEHSGMCAGDIAAIVLGVSIPIIIFLTFFITRKLIERQLKQNPPITEAQIRAMFLSMGRKPSEAQIKSTMNAMKNAKGKNSYKKRK